METRELLGGTSFTKLKKLNEWPDLQSTRYLPTAGANVESDVNSDDVKSVTAVREPLMPPVIPPRWAFTSFS